MFAAKNQRIAAIVEARMGSTRLPGKILEKLEGKPVLQHIVERMRRSRYIDDVIVATTAKESDDIVETFCRSIGCPVYRGSEDDVLSRVLEAARTFHVDIIVEITGDSPVIDWRYADQLVALFYSGVYDYVANTALAKTFPVGMGIQVFPTKVLEKVNQLTNSPVDHEHVSIFIYTHPDLFRLAYLPAETSMNHPELVITLDTPEDLSLIREIYRNLYPVNPDFSGQEVVDFLLKNPQLFESVSGIARKDAVKEEKEWEKRHGKNV